MNIVEAMKKYSYQAELTSCPDNGDPIKHMYWDGYDWVVKNKYTQEIIYHGKDENDALDTLFAEEGD